MPSMHRQVNNQCDPGVKMPSVEGRGERQLYRLASAPVQDPGQEHVQGDEEEQEVRDRDARAPFDERPGPNKLFGHSSDGPTSLDEVYDDQPNKSQADDCVKCDPHMQQLKRAD